MNQMIINEYNFNSNFKKYVDEYCDKNRCTIDEAFCDEKVEKMFWMYTEV